MKNVVKSIATALALLTTMLSVYLYRLSLFDYQRVTYAYLAQSGYSKFVLDVKIPDFLLNFYWSNFSKDELFRGQIAEGNKVEFVFSMIDDEYGQKTVNLKKDIALRLGREPLCDDQRPHIIQKYREYFEVDTLPTFSAELKRFLDNRQAFCFS